MQLQNKIYKFSNWSVNVQRFLFLSGIIVRSFPRKLNSCWNKISFSSIPQSFKILSVEIDYSSQLMHVISLK